MLDKNSELEESSKSIATFKPLLDSYKSQLDAFEISKSAAARETEGLRIELGRTKERLREALEGKEQDGEALGLYAEQVKELEMRGGAGVQDESVDGELDDALAGRTMMDLKVQVRKLGRELESARGTTGDGSRVLVLENLLEDSERVKGRYEREYLQEHREVLAAQASLEEIRSGKSSLGDGRVIFLSYPRIVTDEGDG